MDHELTVAVAALAERLVDLARRDVGLRDDLRSLACAVLAATEPLVPPVAVEVIPTPTAPTPPPTIPTRPVRIEPLPELTLGRYRPPLEIELPSRWDSSVPRHEPPTPVPEPDSSDSEANLPAIAARCRLKAEGLRWTATRRRLLLDETTEFQSEIAPRDRAILDRGRQLDCFLWMNRPEFTVPATSEWLETAAGCFEATADALGIVPKIRSYPGSNRSQLETALDLLAEVQSALRVAIERVGGSNDQDQFEVYDWLRGVATQERFYIRHHMRLSDPASPENLNEIKRRIDALDASFGKVGRQVKRKKSSLNKLRYHIKRIGEASDLDYDSRKVAETVDEMVAEGIPASSVDVRELLLPILDVMPELADPPAGFVRVVREIDHYLADRNVPTEPVAVRQLSPEIARVARLLSGKKVVLIGGYRRNSALEALIEAFDLSELVWLEGREHSSIDRFEPDVARPEVALVLLAIRWSSHSFGEVRRFCENYGKPMARLPAGYNPNQVAAQILLQCSEQLGHD